MFLTELSRLINRAREQKGTLHFRPPFLGVLHFVLGKTIFTTLRLALRLEISLSRVSGYRRSPTGGRDNAPFIRSITHGPDQTGVRSQFLH